MKLNTIILFIIATCLIVLLITIIMSTPRYHLRGCGTMSYPNANMLIYINKPYEMSAIITNSDHTTTTLNYDKQLTIPPDVNFTLQFRRTDDKLLTADDYNYISLSFDYDLTNNNAVFHSRISDVGNMTNFDYQNIHTIRHPAVPQDVQIFDRGPLPPQIKKVQQLRGPPGPLIPL
jgi:hypothetical protein